MTVEQAIETAGRTLAEAAGTRLDTEHRQRVHDSLLERAAMYLKLAKILQAERKYEDRQIAKIRLGAAEN